METPISSEIARAKAIAEEYRNQGYDVILQPSPNQLPDFLVNYTPDIIAFNDNESVVIEVKSRKSLASDPRARELARLLQNQSGWRFELVVVPEGEESPHVDARSFERDDILRGITDAERLNEAGSTEAALLLAWASAEAAVRNLTEAEMELQRITPKHVFKLAVSEGIISREDYELLNQVMQYRNAIAHGFQKKGLEASLVQNLITFTKALLA